MLEVQVYFANNVNVKVIETTVFVLLQGKEITCCCLLDMDTSFQGEHISRYVRLIVSCWETGLCALINAIYVMVVDNLSAQQQSAFWLESLQPVAADKRESNSTEST